MPRNGAGVYSLPVTYEATSNATATAAQHNDPLEDLRTDANTARPIVAGGTGATSATAARAKLGVTGLLDGTTEITPDLGDGTKFEGVAIAGRPLTDEESNTLTKGFNNTAHDEDTKTTGTFTPDPADNNLQYFVNGGAFTLAPPTSSCSVVLQMTNDGSAGAITTTGFTRVTGDTLTTTNGDDFLLFITVNNGFSLLNVVSLQ